MKRSTLNFKVVITQDEDGVFVVECPALPGCHSQGDTVEEALDHIREAVDLCLKVAETDEAYRKTIDVRQLRTPTLWE